MTNPYFNQTWWDTKIKENESSFYYGIGDENADSKIFTRKYIKSQRYKSIIDLGCGPATEFFAYKMEDYDINYLGVDSSRYFFDKNTSVGVPMHLSRAESTSLPASCVEVVFSRHVLEHQPFFEPILEEMIRLGEREAMHVFFFKPWGQEKSSNYDHNENLWHTTYNKESIEDYLKNHPKVKNYTWEEVPISSGLKEGFTEETVLHIFLRYPQIIQSYTSHSSGRLVLTNKITGKKITLQLDPNDEINIENFNY